MNIHGTITVVKNREDGNDVEETNILVVDDEALLVKGIRFNLQNEGYEVITGSDGLEAVQAVQTQHPDLVVLDDNYDVLQTYCMGKAQL